MKFFNLMTMQISLLKLCVAVTFTIAAISSPKSLAQSSPYLSPLWCDGFGIGGEIQGYIGASGVFIEEGAEGAYVADGVRTPFEDILKIGSAPTILQYNQSAPVNSKFTLEDRPNIQLTSILRDGEEPLSYAKLAESTTDITAREIAPGNYKDVNWTSGANQNQMTNRGILSGGGTYYIDKLTLSSSPATYEIKSGTYYIGTLNTGQNARILITGEVTMHIGRAFNGGNGARINMNSGQSVQDFRLFLYHDGTSEADTTITLQNNFEMKGLIYSEFAKTRIIMNNGSYVEGGLVLGGVIDLKNNSQVVINDSPIGTIPGVSNCLDHVRVNYQTPVLSCLAGAVDLVPCANTDCTSLYTSPFDLQMTSVNISPTSNSLWRGDTSIPLNQTISRIAGTTTLRLANVPGGTVRVAGEYYNQINGWTEIFPSRRRCTNEDSAACQIDFIESGLVFSGSNTDPSIPISPKRAGSLFDSYLWALRTDVDVEEGTAACAPLFTEQPVRTVNFRLACTEPGTCSGTPYVIQSAAHPAINVHSAGYTAGQVTFNTSGYAPLTNRFNDVGQIRVDAFLQLESPAGAITEPDDRLAIRTSATGAANLLVYPAGLAIVLSESVSSPNPFKAAGENFNLSVVGLYDPLPTEQPTPLPITPNFGSESSISWAGSSLGSGPLTVGVELVAPNDGVLGTFGGEWLSNTNGAINYTNVYYHEAGVIRAIPQLAGHSYLGHNIGVSGYTQYPLELGTFYPASLSIVDGNFSNAHSCGVFTYMDHDALDLSFQIEALAALRPGETTPSRTVNYTAGFPDLASIGIVAAETLSGSAVPDNLIARFEIFDEPSDTWLAIDAVRSDWVDGVLQFSMPADEYLRFARLATFAPDGPYRDVRVGLYVESETYGETIDAAGAEFEVDVGGTTVSAVRIGTVDDIQDIFYGRLTLENIFGPEDEDLPVIMRAEYYNGSRFVLNTLDSCTPFDYNNLTLVPDAPLPEKGGEVSGELIDGWLPHNNMRWIALGEAGTVEFEYEAPEWLKFLWEEGSTVPSNPRAIGEFGRYRSYDRILFRRQQ